MGVGLWLGVVSLVGGCGGVWEVFLGLVDFGLLFYEVGSLGLRNSVFFFSLGFVVGESYCWEKSGGCRGLFFNVVLGKVYVLGFILDYRD